MQKEFGPFEIKLEDWHIYYPDILIHIVFEAYDRKNLIAHHVNPTYRYTIPINLCLRGD